MPRHALIAFLALLLGLGAARGQTVVGEVERLDFERPESWAAARATAATLFLGYGPPRQMESGELRFGFELGAIPDVSRAKTRVGFNGTKFEDLNKSPVFGRVSIAAALPAGFTAELAWTPPVTIDNVKPDGLFALALERPFTTGPSWRSGVRLFGQRGHVKGAITCSSDVFDIGVPSIERNPFGCARPSNDDIELDYYGLELSASRSLADNRFEPFAALAVTRMSPEMQVNARLLGDIIDRSKRVTRGTTETATVGILYHPDAMWEWSLAVTYTPLDVRRPPDFATRSDDFWSVRLVARLNVEL